MCDTPIASLIISHTVTPSSPFHSLGTLETEQRQTPPPPSHHPIHSALITALRLSLFLHVPHPASTHFQPNTHKYTTNSERLVHFSDMGASPDHPSRRLRSKAAGDAALRSAFPAATIFKPGPIMGDEDDFLNNLLFQVG